ncbi:ankyrin repeat domain-containing protein [Granulicella cerasi]|uniref:Ankyrin repeat domain-containing protein n=1 Tax=Granulicella cerasi TaxID=741063 RepID=A0ABW1ZB43_9BACT|nr:ankyrin repeat domain-containing protein [Granulicella cerasi]
MPTRELPARPHLEHLKKQARELLDAAQLHDPEATARLSAVGVDASAPRLADAQHALALEYGFATWAALKLHVALMSGDAIEAFVAAVRAGDADAVLSLLAKHPVLRARLDDALPGFDFDQTALLTAVHQQHRKHIDALLDAGADPNARSRWWAGGFGVLDFATPELAEHLILRGATLDAHSAARLGKLDRLRTMLADDPSLVHARGGDGQTPLHFAANVDVAALLLQHGAEVDARDIDHESTAAQYMAADRERKEVVRLLLDQGATPDIMMAAALGDLTLVERLLRENSDVVRMTVSDTWFPRKNLRAGGVIYMYTFGNTKTPHLIAHEYGHAAVFALLMRHSAPWLQLVVSAEVGDAATMDKLLDQMPDRKPQMHPANARRLVGVAVRNQAEALRLLVEHNWPIDVPLDNGQTALHYAAWHGNLAMVETLLAHGAPVNVFENEHGGSPLAWALHGSLNGWHRDTGDYVGVVKALLNAGANVPKPERPLEATKPVLAALLSHAKKP